MSVLDPRYKSMIDRLKNLQAAVQGGSMDPNLAHLEGKKLWGQTQPRQFKDQKLMPGEAPLPAPQLPDELIQAFTQAGTLFREKGSAIDPGNTLNYGQAASRYNEAQSIAAARAKASGLSQASPDMLVNIYRTIGQAGTDPAAAAALQKLREGYGGGVTPLMEEGGTGWYYDPETGKVMTGPPAQPWSTQTSSPVKQTGTAEAWNQKAEAQMKGQTGTPGQGATQTGTTSVVDRGSIAAEIKSMRSAELTQVASLFQDTISALEAKQKDLIARAATQKTEIDPDTQASIDRLRESMNEGIMAAKEEANRRGILDSGIALALTQKPRTEFQRGQTYIEGSRLKAIKDRLDQQLAALDSRIYQTQMAKTQGLMSTRQNLLNLYSNAALTEQGRAQQQGQFNEQMTYQMGRDQVTDAKGLVDLLSQMGQQASAKEQQAFENALKEAGVTGTYQGQPTFEKQTTEAGFTGTYQGKPTLQAKLPKVKAGGGDILQQYLNTVARLGDVQAMINDPLNRGDKTGLLAQLDTLSNIANSLGAKLGGQYGFGQGAGGGAGTGTGAGTGADTGTGAGTGAAAAKPSGAVDPAVQAWVKEQQRAGVDAAAIAAELRANGMAPARYGIKER